MNPRVFWGFWASCLILSATGIKAEEIYTTSWVEGHAPIIIDGRLSDWDAFDLQVGSIGHYIVWNNTSPPAGNIDLGATFRSLADDDALYFLIQVQDDTLVFNESDYVQRWNDDAVEIFFDGDRVDIAKRKPDLNDGQIRITWEEDHTALEGVSGLTSSFLHYTPPLMWEAIGVEAIMTETQGGYTVEARIPKYLLGIESFTVGTQIGMNLRVMDDDDGDRMDRFMDWANDQENLSSELRTANFGIWRIGRKISAVATEEKAEIYVKQGGLKELEVVIGNPYTQVYEVTKSIAEESDHVSLLAQLEEMGNDEVLPLVAAVQRSDGPSEEAITTLVKLVSKAPSGKVRSWAIDQIAGNYLELGEFEKADDIYEGRLLQEQDPYLLLSFGDIYLKQKKFHEALAHYRQVAERGYSWQKSLAQYSIALCYVDMTDYDKARKELEELKIKFPDDKNAQVWSEYLLAFMEADEGKTDSASYRCQTILNAKEGELEEKLYVHTLHLLGEIRFSQGKEKEAKEILEELKMKSLNYPMLIQDSNVMLQTLRKDNN